MKRILFFLASSIFCANAFCSSTDSTVKTKIYHVRYLVDGVLVGGLGIADYSAIKRIKDKPALTVDELNFLNSPSEVALINRFDRWALHQKASDRPFYNNLSDYSLDGMILVPCLLAFNKTIRKDWADLLIMYVEGHAVTLFIYTYSFIGPTFQNRYRPRAYYTYFDVSTRETGQNRNSFYSGHVASTAYATFFMAKVYSDYHPDLGAAKYLLYTAATIPPVVMSYLRIKALDHFPSDCAVGLMLGAFIGIIVPELHKYPCHKNLSFGMYTSPEGGMGLSMYWKLPDRQLFPLAN